MAKTIGNPLSWSARTIGAAGAHLSSVGGALAGGSEAVPQVRRLTLGDLGTALRRGRDDFAHFRTDVAALCVIYPVIGLILAWAAFDRALLPLLFPMASGFALVGPAAAVGMYELSRRREAGENPGWAAALSVIGKPSFGAILVLGLLLFAAFLAWLMVAGMIYAQTMGPDMPQSAREFARDVLMTGPGRWLMILGIGAGFLFAAAVLAATVVSFPMLVDRNVGVPVAVATSLRVTAENPMVIGAWGLIVATLLVLGSLPVFAGLILVMPVLGHATWHLYRLAVEPG